MTQKQDKIDPELLDIALQLLTALSAFAAMGSTWIDYRNRADKEHHDHLTDHMRSHLRDLRRALEDCIDATSAALRIMAQANHVAGRNVLAEKPRFGLGMMFDQITFEQVSGHLATLDHANQRARNAARALQSSLPYADLRATANIEFDNKAFEAEMNAILFESPTFDDAFGRLRRLSNKAEDFINDLERALRGN